MRFSGKWQDSWSSRPASSFSSTYINWFLFYLFSFFFFGPTFSLSFYWISLDLTWFHSTSFEFTRLERRTMRIRVDSRVHNPQQSMIYENHPLRSTAIVLMVLWKRFVIKNLPSFLRSQRARRQRWTLNERALESGQLWTFLWVDFSIGWDSLAAQPRPLPQSWCNLHASHGNKDTSPMISDRRTERWMAPAAAVAKCSSRLRQSMSVPLKPRQQRNDCDSLAKPRCS